MQHIGGALKQLIRSSSLEKGLQEQKAIDFWPSVVGQKISENTEPVSYGLNSKLIRGALNKTHFREQ